MIRIPRIDNMQTTIKTNTNEIIIQGIINGDRRILKNFYRENISYIRGYILRNSGNIEDVEDVFQDALVVLYENLQSDFFEIRVSIKTYFYGICKNTWHNRLRKKKVSITDNVSISDPEDSFQFIEDFENNDREHVYRKHFQKLSVANKKVLQLYFEGKSMTEISGITGYSVGYTRKKKFEAKEKLISMIEKDPIYRELQAV